LKVGLGENQKFILGQGISEMTALQEAGSKEEEKVHQLKVDLLLSR